MKQWSVAVTCDRCGRPGWKLEVSDVTGEICVDGARIADGDESRYWAGVLAGPVAHRYRAEPGGRPGAFILPADAPGSIRGREKLVCIGRKHPRYQRIVTWENAERAYLAAVAAGRDRIRLSEI
jgi:hypothetical protein